MKLLKNEINLFFYSKKFDEVMQIHNNKSLDEKMGYIVRVLQRFLRRFTTNEDGQEIIEINVGNDDERISSLITYNNLSNHLINYT